jgi:hypothetical protein
MVRIMDRIGVLVQPIVMVTIEETNMLIIGGYDVRVSIGMFGWWFHRRGGISRRWKLSYLQAFNKPR